MRPMNKEKVVEVKYLGVVPQGILLNCEDFFFVFTLKLHSHPMMNTINKDG